MEYKFTEKELRKLIKAIDSIAETFVENNKKLEAIVKESLEAQKALDIAIEKAQKAGVLK